MPGSITRQYCWRSPDFNKSGPRPPVHTLADTASHLDTWGLLNHGGGGGGGRVQVRRSKQTQGEQRKQWITEINQSFPATTSPPLREEEEEAACWWLYDGWLIQDPSDLWWWITARWNRTLAKLKNCWLRGLRETSSCSAKHADVVKVTVSSVERLFVFGWFTIFLLIKYQVRSDGYTVSVNNWRVVSLIFL